MSHVAKIVQPFYTVPSVKYSSTDIIKVRCKSLKDDFLLLTNDESPLVTKQEGHTCQEQNSYHSRYSHYQPDFSETSSEDGGSDSDLPNAEGAAPTHTEGSAGPWNRAGIELF